MDTVFFVLHRGIENNDRLSADKILCFANKRKELNVVVAFKIYLPF